MLSDTSTGDRRRGISYQPMTQPAWRPTPKKAYKTRDPRVTSSMMSRVRSRDNVAEIALRKTLWNRGHRYRVHSKHILGKPDLVFSRTHVAVFVDGDYWHGRALREGGADQLRLVIRGRKFEWWRAKLQKNIDRDDYVTQGLMAAGWNVVRIWESDVLANAAHAADRVEAAITRGERSSAKPDS